MWKLVWALAVSTLSLGTIAATTTGCGGTTPTYVRGSEIHGLDDPAMGLGLDQRDLDQLFHENMGSLRGSSWFSSTGAPRPVVAVLPIENQTTEHLDSQLGAFISMIETDLQQSGRFDVVAYSVREQILAELNLQQGAAFDQSRALSLGRQLGVHYFVTGRVYDNAERSAEMRRVQYFMFMQAIDVSTGVIAWQNQSELTKGIVPLEN